MLKSGNFVPWSFFSLVTVRGENFSSSRGITFQVMYSKHWKMLNCGKLITVNFTLLSDIDKRKTLIESSAADVIHFLFLAGLSIGFSSGN